ncbi:ADP-ribosyltransferase [Nocardiopsis sp. NPDC006198]|uniref:ADP-ribosyltransferase n=1 Tax=Nocardiopsis sp. NPDC006198 TaxID=3154472 RepID=UPI0033AA9E12
MTAEMCTPAGGVINPDAFPIPALMPARLEYRAGRLRANAALVAGSGHDITGAWSGLSACYTAPEAETLFAVVGPVAVDGDSVSDGMDRAATALEVFAEEVRGIKERWAALTSDANAFLASIEGDDDWRKADTFSGEWWSGDESPKVAEHQALLDRADALRLEYEAAEVECANAVNAGLPVRTNFVHADSGTEPAVRQYAHGYNEYLGDMDMPWGGSMETDHAWFVDVGHSVSDFAVGALEDLGGALGAHSSEGWFEMNMGDALVEYHGESLTTLGAMAGLYDPATGEWGEVSWETFGNTWTEVAHSVVPWREWDDRPGYVIGTAVLNIGSMVAGAALTATGVGAVVGVPLLLWRGSAILNKVDLPDMPDADGAGNGIDVELRLNLPFSGGNGPTLASFHLDLPDLRGSLNPSETAELQDALNRLENWSPEPAEGSGSPTDPTSQDLADGMTVEDVLNPVSAESTRLRDEYGDDFGALDRDTDGDGSGTGDGSDSGDSGDGDRVPALVGARPDTEEGAGTPDTSPDWTIDLTGGGFDLPGDRTGGEGANLGDRSPTVNNSVGDGGGTADSPFPDGGGSVHHTDGPGFSSDGHGFSPDGDSASDRNGGVYDPPPGIDPGDPADHYPGEMGPDGIRRFDDNGEEYARRVLDDPDLNPHTFDSLPPEQRRAVYDYTVNSWLNSVARADTVQAGLDTLRRNANDWNTYDPANSTMRGWSLYELNGLSRPGLDDLHGLWRRAADGEIRLTDLQRGIMEDVFRSPDPYGRLGLWLSEAGLPGRIAEQYGGTFPDADAVRPRMGDLDSALERPLPEGVEAVRGLHGIDHLAGFDPADPQSIVGTIQSDAGYMSTALGRDPIVVDGRPFAYTVHLDVPEGAHGLWVGGSSAYPGQREIIFPRETRYEIVSVRVEAGTTFINARILPPTK